MQIGRCYDMVANNEDKAKQGSSSTFTSFHIRLRNQKKQSEVSEKTSIYHCHVFLPDEFHRIFTEKDTAVCFKAGKCILPLVFTGSSFTSVMALRTRILTPVGSPFLSHKLNEVAMTCIQLELLTDVHPLDHSSIITCFQRQIIQCLPCSQNKS